MQVSAEPVELPDHERVTGAKRLQALSQTRAVIAPTGRLVLVEAFVVDAGLEERVSLRVSGLRPVCFRDPRVADEHRRFLLSLIRSNT